MANKALAVIADAPAAIQSALAAVFRWSTERSSLEEHPECVALRLPQVRLRSSYFDCIRRPNVMAPPAEATAAPAATQVQVRPSHQPFRCSSHRGVKLAGIHC